MGKRGTEVDLFFLDFLDSPPYTNIMKNKKLKSTAYGRLSISEEEFNRRVWDAVNVSFDSLVSEVRPLRGQGLKKPSTEI